MRKNNQKNGFTLIETMIAVSLFIVIVMAGTGALLNANLLFQKSRDMRSIMDSLSFIMEDMGRSLRTGTNYQCFDASHSNLSYNDVHNGTPRSCSSGWAIAFESADGSHNNTDQWVYYISNGGKIFKSVDEATNFVQLTPDEVVIDQIYGFSVLGAESPSATPPDFQQPFVTIKLVGHINLPNGSITPFSLQTSVSQRVIDI